MNEPTQSPTHDGCGHPCPASTFWIKGEKKNVVQLKLLLPALCKSPQSGSEETYTSLTKLRTDEGKCFEPVMFCVCSHLHGRVGTAWQRSSACAVCFECSPFVCVSGSVRSAFQTFWARYSPATTPTCQLTCSPHTLLRSSLCLSLLFGSSVRADERPPRWWGGSSCNCWVSPSLTGESGGCFSLPEEAPPTGANTDLFILLRSEAPPS